MTLASDLPLDQPQHIVLDDVSWELYEHLLQEVGAGHLRLTYCDGRLEIMSPLPIHEMWSRRIYSLIQFLCVERSIPMVPLGSTTFRDQAKKKGLEPDECFYIQHADHGHKMDAAFDPKIDPPPDLVVEVDITRRSILKQPIYAALGIPELWRYDGKRLHVLMLQDDNYKPTPSSQAFPFLPIGGFETFINRFNEQNDTAVLLSFQQWVRTLR
jgi:Uma2 family endonuclease